jgi:hypothetical protein
VRSLAHVASGLPQDQCGQSQLAEDGHSAMDLGESVMPRPLVAAGCD